MMKKLGKLLHVAVLVPVGFATGCAMHPRVPENIGETFVLERDMVGETVARGSFSAINGTHREFTTYIQGTWDGETLTLVEDFEFDDGVKETKTWVLSRLDNGEWTGVREDIVGTARGFQDGDVFRLVYDLALPDENGAPGRTMRFRDVLALDEQGNVLNNATVGMWGFRVGKVDLVMKRPPEAIGSNTQ